MWDADWLFKSLLFWIDIAFLAMFLIEIRAQKIDLTCCNCNFFTMSLKHNFKNICLGKKYLWTESIHNIIILWQVTYFAPRTIFFYSNTLLDQTLRLSKHSIMLLCLRPGGGGSTRIARAGIRLVHGLTKSTLITYFSGMKIDPKYTFLHAFFLICLSYSFLNLSLWPKTHPFFQLCTFLHP